MTFGSILLLAFGLAMDATAVGAARGAVCERLRPRDVAFVAGTFGAFHAVMPALGWLAGSQLGAAIASWDHWFTFAVLAVIGIKMIVQGIQEESELVTNPLAPRVILGLAIATSIDALAVGATLPLVGAAPILAIATISAVTALATVAGLVAGHWLRRSLGRPTGIAGGLVLVAMGTKILLEHLGYA